MKITFVYPRFQKFLNSISDLNIERGMVEYYLGDFTTPPSLGIPIMKSWTPPEIETVLIDDNSGDPIDYDAPTDLVAINCFTPQATRAFEIADNFRASGKKVIMGGFFPSFMVDECLKHADSVNVGEVEPTWLKIIEDVRNGELKRKYIGGSRFDLAKMKIPDRSIFYSKKSYDWEEDLVQFTRGCSYSCAMCSIPAHMGNRIRLRPIENVVEEIKTLKYENVYLADDTLFFPQKRISDYSIELFKAIEPLGKKYFVASTMALRIDNEFLDLASKAGVRNFYCTMNVDPISIKALQGGKKEQQMLVDLVKALEDRNIRFFGSFAIGRDWDDESIADRILELYQKSNIRTSEFFFFTPYPGSVHWDRLKRQNRIFDYDWNHYNGAHVVAKHPTLSEDQLYKQFEKVWNEFFKMQKDQNAAHFEPLTYDKGKEVVGIPLQKKGVRDQAVITGIGVLSPIGNDTKTVLESLKNSKSGITKLTKIDTSNFRTPYGGEIKNFNASDKLSTDEIAEYEDDYLKFAITSARNAIEMSGLKWDGINRKIALVLGTCNGGLLSAEAEYKWKHGKSDAVFNEKMNLQAQYYGFGKALAKALGIGGEVWLVTTACSSTTGAIGLAQMLINRGYYDTVVVGGSDSLCVANVSGFNGLKATSTTKIAPFSVPTGLNIGEASAFWVVEDMEKAILRKTKCYGKLIGHATTSDAYHPTTPDPRGDGVFRTLKNALADSGINITDLGCINAHGTGTDANDRAESKGLGKFMADNKIPVVSTKSFFGHCMGSTGILEATCNLLSMNDGFIPPTINFTEPRPGCNLDYVPNVARDKKYSAFASANYAFGGNNASVIISDWDLPVPPRPKKSGRVVITGAGVISSLGFGFDSTLTSLQECKKEFSSIDNLKLSGMKSNLAGFVKEFKGSDIDRRIDFNAMNKISKFATVSARLALNDAGLKVNRRNSESVGIAMGVCNGPSEMEHMDSVFKGDSYEADISSFSNITANSTAGWVSNALCLKGINTTLSPGPNAGLQAMAWAYNSLLEDRAECIIASASDEIYPQTYYNYDLMKWLYSGSKESSYKCDLSEARKKVLGEGSASIVLETLESAQKREANIIAEMLGYGMSADADEFTEQCMNPDGVIHAITTALSRSNMNSLDLDLVVWAPQGNMQDKKVLDGLTAVLNEHAKDVPMVTTTFNTGYIESASILVSLASVIASIKNKKSLWPQITGLEDVDSRDLNISAKNILCVASSDVGYSFAVVLKSDVEL